MYANAPLAMLSGIWGGQVPTCFFPTFHHQLHHRSLSLTFSCWMF